MVKDLAREIYISYLQAFPQCESVLIRAAFVETRRNFKMLSFNDFRYAIIFCIALNKTSAETVATLTHTEPYIDNVMYQNII